MVVHNQAELAAAILSVSHDRPAKVILERQGKKPLVYEFDYAVKTCKTVGGNNYANRFSAINERLKDIVKKLRKLPKGYFE